MTHFPISCAASFSTHSIRLAVSTNTSPNHYFFSLDSTFLFSSYQTVSVKPGRTKHPHIKCGHCWQLTFAKCFVSIFSSSVNIKSTRGEPIWKSPEIIEKHFHSPQELCGIKWMDTHTSMSPLLCNFLWKTERHHSTMKTIICSSKMMLLRLCLPRKQEYLNITFMSVQVITKADI